MNWSALLWTVIGVGILALLTLIVVHSIHKVGQKGTGTEDDDIQ